VGWLGDVYGEIPSAIRWLFYLEVLLIWGSTAWLVVLFGRALAQRRRPPGPPPPPGDLLWIFLVPALNEELTIRDSVARLAALDVPHRVILVIDDGSTDGTGAALAELKHDDLAVLRRDLPQAQLGKGAALNAAWRFVHRQILSTGRYAGWNPARVIIGVVDADGRLQPGTPVAVARHFADPTVGGVQSQVRIYNRYGYLTWCQDVEFAIYGRLYQQARSGWGTAGMGGNGQFNRLSALDSIADTSGPWRDTLTEDLDLGLRLIVAGWRNRQEARVGVDQQGLNNLRRLLRQRTRWAQGNLQALHNFRSVVGADVGRVARADLGFLLLLPITQMVVSAGLVASLIVNIFADVPFWAGASWLVFLFYGITFGSAVLGLTIRAPVITPMVVLRAIVLSIPYSGYAWVIVPALVRAVYREVTAQRSWAKTAREPLRLASEGKS
jgi:cellulose synthase/poly-beta-1,6-N-acetylglucosamine synthase-like glycosyltransferase